MSAVAEVQYRGPLRGVSTIGFIENAPGGLNTSAHGRSILSEGQNLPFAFSCNQDVVAFDLATPFTDPDTSHGCSPKALSRGKAGDRFEARVVKPSSLLTGASA